MKNVNVTLDNHVHARLKEYARRNKMSLADALRYALDHCLPPLVAEPKVEQGADEESNE